MSQSLVQRYGEHVLHMNVSGLTSRFFLLVLVCLAPMAIALVLYLGASIVVISMLLVSIVMAGVGSWMVAGRIDRSLERFERATERLAKGDLSAKVYPPRIPQLVGLANGFNLMATQLKQRVDALTLLSGEQDAILRSMAEGVVTIDATGRIQRLNAAAQRLLEVAVPNWQGRLVPEVIHHAEVQRFIGEAVLNQEADVEVVVVPSQPERVLQIYATPLEGSEGGRLGTLVVFQDTTRIAKLENIRRDFIANVSHELRTPVTSIKGFVETLREGAKDDPEALDKFLGIIGHHADRLSAIFNDLLTLARLEAQGEDARVETMPSNAHEIVQGALEACRLKLEERAAQVEVSVPLDLHVMANANLLEQALVNLIENAVKYSEGVPRLVIHGEQVADKVCLSVSDNGPGIAKPHLTRLFERFYRVDHGRSRKMGGTGLGLSIVKHIAQVHGGEVQVESAPGKGSVFSITLQAA
jgi:two-component system phosphate regulon sensor histidine kinase PhoR